MPLNLPSCSSKPVWLSWLFFFFAKCQRKYIYFLMSVDLVFSPMKVYPMLFGPQCSSTYLLLCLTEESKSYRFLGETSLLHNFVLDCRIVVVLLWSGMRLDHWQVEKKDLVRSTNAQWCEKIPGTLFLWSLAVTLLFLHAGNSLL